MRSPPNPETIRSARRRGGRPARLRRRRRRRRRAARPVSQPDRRGARARPFSHAAEGADRGGSGDDRRRRGARSGGAGRRGRGRSPLAVPPAEDAAIAGEDLPLTIVFEDEHLLIVDKPAGLVVHPAPGHAAGTLVNALIRHCGDSLSGVGGVKRPGIVHRLDKDTSGLLVVAKNDAAHQGLAALFADHGRSGSLRREYRALVWGAPDARGGNGRRRRSAATRSAARRWRWSPTSAAGRRSPTGGVEERARPGEPRRLPAGDRAHPPDPRPSRPYRPSAARRFGLRSGLQDQGEPPCRRRRGRRSTRSAARPCTPRSSPSTIRSPASRWPSKAPSRTI